MAAQIRVLRRRIKSVQSTKKITRAMELIAASRIARAQQRARAAAPYADEITRVISQVASQGGSMTHPLVVDRPTPRSAAVIVVTSDRGLAGGYNSNVLRGRRGRQRDPAPGGQGARSLPRRPQGRRLLPVPPAPDRRQLDRVHRAADVRTRPRRSPTPSSRRFVRGGEEPDGVDEVHLVYTQFVSGLVQRPVAKRLLPLVVEYSDEPSPHGPVPLYDFEPDAESVLDALLPRYAESRIFTALLESAASESAARRRAMKAATDNAEELHQGADPRGQHRTPGIHHPGNQGDRRRRRGADGLRRKQWELTRHDRSC